MKSHSSDKSNSIGIAVAGLGFGESVHIPALKANSKAELISLWHHRKERLIELSEKHMITTTSNWNDLINNPSVQGIIIATPPQPRYKLAYEALNAGKHLLLEKPVALSSEEIEELQKLAINKRLSVAVDFEYRAVPLFMQAKRLIERNLLGDIWLVKLDWLMSSRANKSRPWNWYSEVEKGGGVLGALGTHAFDIIHWLIGPTESISAISSTSIKERIEPETGQKRPVSSEDVILAQMMLNEQNSQNKIPCQVSISSVAREGRGCWLEVYGSKGTLKLGSENQTDYVHGFGLWLTEVGDKSKSITADNDLQFNKTWTDGRIAPVSRLQSWWLESIKNGNPIVPGLAEGFNSQRVCEIAIDSAQHGQRLFI